MLYNLCEKGKGQFCPRVASPIKLNLTGLPVLGNFLFSFSTKNNINTNYK